MKHDVKGNIERRIEETGRRGRRLKQVIEELTEKRGCCILKAEALDRNLSSIRKRQWTCGKP
jgi:ferritin-like metal-binding protein YciE